MRVVSIISEYNPFHNGHKYQIEKAKKLTNSDYCVIIMSSNFVQRGEPAIVDKWTRTKMALRNGADLVIELPVHFATSSAEFFSYASVILINNLGIIDYLCFGSEVGDLSILKNLANVLCNEPEEFKSYLHEQINKGISFATARSNALIKFITNNNLSSLSQEELKHIIKSPNNILGIEYLKSLIRLNSTIKPVTIKRIGTHYHDEHIVGNIASATGIRKAVSESNLNIIDGCMPNSAFKLLEEQIQRNKGPIFLDDFSSLFQYKLKTSTPSQLARHVDITEGLENRILNASTNAFSISDIITNTSTKRYPITKIKRAILHILLDINKKDYNSFIENNYVQYVKVLGFRKESSVLLKNMKDHCNLPIISNVKDSMKTLNSIQRKMLEQEIKSTDIYNIILKDKLGIDMLNDFTQRIIIE